MFGIKKITTITPDPGRSVIELVKAREEGVAAGRKQERDHIVATEKMAKAKANFIESLPDFGPKSSLVCPKCGSKSWVTKVAVSGYSNNLTRRSLFSGYSLDYVRPDEDIVDCGTVEYLSLTCACGYNTKIKTKDFKTTDSQ